jgi:hypothetical protein
VEETLGVEIDVEPLEQEAAVQSAALQQVFAGNPEASAYLERLQSLSSEEELRGGGDIAEEVERFLRNRDQGGGGPTPFSP